MQNSFIQGAYGCYCNEWVLVTTTLTSEQQSPDLIQEKKKATEKVHSTFIAHVVMVIAQARALPSSQSAHSTWEMQYRHHGPKTNTHAHSGMLQKPQL